MVSVEDFEEVINLFSDMYTFFVFFMACVLTLALLSSYVVVQFLRSSWINFLEKRFPDLEFVRRENLRACVDTQRNFGVVTTLLSVRGSCDVSFIKRRLEEEIIEKRLEDGRLAFRHLRMTLTTRWGKYAWMSGPFRLENHVSVGWSVYRGRPVCELNIQECVSEMVSKYLSMDVPPWHLTIIPTSSDRFYLLLRVHHLLLSDTTAMRLGDFLPMKIDARVADDHISTTWETSSRPHPFLDLYKSPKALPALSDRLSQILCNQWNEFLSVYDPVENPAALKNPTLTYVLAALLITFITWIRSIANGLPLAVDQQHKRSVTCKLFLISLWNSFGPLRVLKRAIYICMQGLRFWVITLPVLFVCEVWAMWKINDEQYSDRSYIKLVIDSWKNIQSTLREMTYFSRICISGPRVVFEELFGSRGTHYLQTIPRGGRKVVSWSVGVPVEHIKAIEDATGASSSEVVYTALSASLRDFFMIQGRSVPLVLPTTAQTLLQDELFSSLCCVRQRMHGVVCLAVPTNNPWDDEDGPITELHLMQQMVLRTRLRQPFLYLLTSLELDHGLFTKALPMQLVRLITNALSRRFPVSLTEVLPTVDVNDRKPRLWGQEVERIMYWNPPEANVCLSLTILSDGDTVSVGVMADCHLSPFHSAISSTFPEHIRRLATAAGALLQPRLSSIPSAGGFLLQSIIPADDSDDSVDRRSTGSLSSSGDDFELERDDESYM